MTELQIGQLNTGVVSYFRGPVVYSNRDTSVGPKARVCGQEFTVLLSFCGCGGCSHVTMLSCRWEDCMCMAHIHFD